ncbi:hypothetical protein GCM10009610_43890 [Pseudonocardia xinjiangensis]
MRPIMSAQSEVAQPSAAGPLESELRALLAAGALEFPLPRAGRTAQRWSRLAEWGRRDLGLARLAEGHTDAVAILAEAGHDRRPGALYGVWAARSAGTGARLVASGDELRLHGTVRFCSGARTIDRALVVADAPVPARGDGPVLVDIALDQPGVVPDPSTWATAAMAGADTADVRFDDVLVPAASLVAQDGWYTARPGFLAGGGGVAAVWWGGAAGVLDRAVGHLPPEPDPHQLAHVGELHALMEAASALLTRTARALDPPAANGAAPAPAVSDSPAPATAAPATAAPATAELSAGALGASLGAAQARELAEVRCAVERIAREVVERVPRMVGAAPLSRDGRLAQALADLSLYIRQHHGERDYAALGAAVVAMRNGR